MIIAPISPSFVVSGFKPLSGTKLLLVKIWSYFAHTSMLTNLVQSHCGAAAARKVLVMVLWRLEAMSEISGYIKLVNVQTEFQTGTPNMKPNNPTMPNCIPMSSQIKLNSKSKFSLKWIPCIKQKSVAKPIPIANC